MRKDPTEFRERFKRWKSGELVYSSGKPLPAYDGGNSPSRTFYKTINSISKDAEELSDEQYEAWYDSLPMAGKSNVVTNFGESPDIDEDSKYYKAVVAQRLLANDDDEALYLNGGLLPEVKIKERIPNKNPQRYITLNTYYPVISAYPFTGHSELYRQSGNYEVVDGEVHTPNLMSLPDAAQYNEEFWIDKLSSDPTYNFVGNNCSDATRRALEYVYGKKLNPAVFTTPGDVEDFAKAHNAIKLNDHDVVKSGGVYANDSIKQSRTNFGLAGTTRYAIPVTAEQYANLMLNSKYFNNGPQKISYDKGKSVKKCDNGEVPIITEPLTATEQITTAKDKSQYEANRVMAVGAAMANFLPFLGSALNYIQDGIESGTTGTMGDIGEVLSLVGEGRNAGSRRYKTRGFDRKVKYKTSTWGSRAANPKMIKAGKALGFAGQILDTPHLAADIEQVKAALGMNYNQAIIDNQNIITDAIKAATKSAPPSHENLRPVRSNSNRNNTLIKLR